MLPETCSRIETHSLSESAATLTALSAPRRVEWALQNLPGEHALSSSFGIQAAVMLHLVTRVYPDIPVIFIDTGYHFPETYRFVDALTEQLRLNLQVLQPRLTAAWQEARYGRRWQQGEAGLDAYNEDNKLEPMRRGLRELNVGTWFSGVRRDQSAHRRQMSVVEQSGGRLKVHPIIDWRDRDIYDYHKANGLPWHPLREHGYASIGDWHSTTTLMDAGSEEKTRFLGIKRECGLHDNLFGREEKKTRF